MFLFRRSAARKHTTMSFGVCCKDCRTYLATSVWLPLPISCRPANALCCAASAIFSRAMKLRGRNDFILACFCSQQQRNTHELPLFLPPETNVQPSIFTSGSMSERCIHESRSLLDRAAVQQLSYFPVGAAASCCCCCCYCACQLCAHDSKANMPKSRPSLALLRGLRAPAEYRTTSIDRVANQSVGRELWSDTCNICLRLTTVSHVLFAMDPRKQKRTKGHQHIFPEMCTK